MDSKIADVLMEIKESIGNIEGNISGIEREIKNQRVNCQLTTSDIYKKVEKNTQFRSWMKGGIAFASISSVTALIIGIVRVFMG